MTEKISVMHGLSNLVYLVDSGVSSTYAPQIMASLQASLVIPILRERITMSSNVFNCMVDNTPNLTRFNVQGDLPELRVNFSDRKYNIVMSMIDVALPNFSDESEAE